MNQLFVKGKFQLTAFNWASDAVDIGVLLMENDFVFDETDNAVSQVVAAGTEATGTGYARKIIEAADRHVVEEDLITKTAQLSIFDGNVIWSALDAGTDLRVILFFVTGTDVDDDSNLLLGYYDTGTNVPINSGGADVQLNFNTLGAIQYN